MVLMLFSLSLSAGSHSKQMVDSIHFLIPGGAGGGWDGTARGTGEALTKSGLADLASRAAPIEKSVFSMCIYIYV